MNKKIIKGFTLIELLVVIAIIGILSSVTVVTFSGTQAKAKDGTSKVELASMKTEALVYILDRTSWAGYCTITNIADTDVGDLRDSIEERQGNFICTLPATPGDVLIIGFKNLEVATEYTCFRISSTTKRAVLKERTTSTCPE